MTLLLDTNTIHDIPVLRITPGGAERRPVIFFIHGFGSTQEAVEWFATPLL